MHYPFGPRVVDANIWAFVRKTQANDLNDDLEFSRSCRKLLNAIIILCYRCAHVAHLYIATEEIVFNIDDIAYFQN